MPRKKSAAKSVKSKSKKTKKTNDEALHYVAVANADDVHVHLIDVTKTSLGHIKRFEQVLSLRKQKLEKLEQFEELLAEIKQRMVKIHKAMPKQKVAVDHIQTLPITKAVVEEEVVREPLKVSEPVPEPVIEHSAKLSEIDSLEEELLAIEGKLSNVK